MNFLISIVARFNVLNIELNGENIYAQFAIVQSELKLKVKKGKMVQLQLTLIINIESFAKTKETKENKKGEDRD